VHTLAAYRHALQASALFPTQPVGATSGFYAATTLAVRLAPLTPSGSGPSPWLTAQAQSARTRRMLPLIALGLFFLALLLVSSIVVALSLGNHTGGQPSASSTTAAPASTLPPTATQPARTCMVNDSARILGQDQICQTARSLSSSLVVNTSNVSGDNGDGPNSPQSIDAHTILITIVIGRHHGHERTQAQVMITGGSEVPLSNDQYQSAVDAFNQAAQDGNYTSATIDAIQALQENGA